MESWLKEFWVIVAVDASVSVIGIVVDGDSVVVVIDVAVVDSASSSSSSSSSSG